MTLGELKTEIAYEAKVDGDSNWDNHIIRFISDEASQLAIETKDELLLVSRFALTSADISSSLVRLPTNFMKEVEVRFKTTSPSTAEWILPPNTGIVPPPYLTGKPKAYEFFGSEATSGVGKKSSIRLLPEYTLTASDSLLVTYWRQPFEELTPATDTSTLIYPFAWLGLLKKRVVNRINTYQVDKCVERVQLFNQSIAPTVQAEASTVTPTPAYASPRNA